MSPSQSTVARRIGRLAGAEELRVLRAAIPPLPVCWIVGGFVRDRLLGRASRDLDLALETDAAGAAAPAARLAAALGTRAHLVGTPPHAVWRLAGPRLTVELWPRGELDLSGDLRRRDFTVNALAFRLPDGPLVDLAGGVDDLVQGRLRAVRRTNLLDDPVRVLRAARFAATHPELDLEPRTAAWLRQLAPRVAHAPRERLGQELATLLAATGAGRGLAALLDLGLLAPSAPAPERVDPAWLRRRSAAAGLLARPSRHPLRAAAREATAAAGLALLVRGWGPVDDEALAPYAWPRDTRRVAATAAAALDPTTRSIATGGVALRRELLWRAGVASPALIALGAACAAVTGEPISPWRRLWRLWRSRHVELLAPDPLVSAAEVIELLELPGPGPAVGEALRRLARARARGELRTPAQARRMLAGRCAGVGSADFGARSSE